MRYVDYQPLTGFDVFPPDLIEWDHPLNRGLVSRWLVLPPFDGSPKFYDLARSNHGALTGRPAWQGPQARPGGWGSLSFNGTADLVDVNPLSGELSAAVTLEWWARPTDVNNNQYLCQGYAAATPNRRAIILGFQDGFWNIYNDGYPTGTATDTQVAATAGVWHHVAYTYDGTLIKGYLNGVQQINVTASFAPAGGGTMDRRTFGSSGAADWYAGGFDDFMIYSRALSAAEVALLYHDSRQGSPLTLRRLKSIAYSFPEEATATTVPGSVGLGFYPGGSILFECDLVNKHHPLNRGLVSRWLVLPPFDGSPKFYDIAGNNHGTLTGPLWQGPGARLGGWGSLSFDGTDDYVEVADNVSLSAGGGNNFSFSMWLKPRSLADFANVFGKWGSAAGDHEYLIFVDGSDRLVWGVRNTSGSEDAVTASNFGALSTGVWYFVVVWYNKATSEIGISINGVVNTTAHSGDTVDGAAAFRLGGVESGGVDYDGLMDDVGYWTRVITATEIQALYNESRQGYPTTLNRLQPFSLPGEEVEAVVTAQTFNAAWAYQRSVVLAGGPY